ERGAGRHRLGAGRDGLAASDPAGTVRRGWIGPLRAAARRRAGGRRHPAVQPARSVDVRRAPGDGGDRPGGARRVLMCGRFTLTVHHIGDLVTELGAEIDPTLLEAYRPRYNIAPGDTHL